MSAYKLISILALALAGSAAAELEPLSPQDMARATEESRADVTRRALPRGDGDNTPSVFDVIERERDYNRDIQTIGFQPGPNPNEPGEQFERIQQIIEQNTGILIPGIQRQ
ncbi:MAG: hypothetical protein ACQES2_04555 [Pseudomonadota bacterium]